MRHTKHRLKDRLRLKLRYWLEDRLNNNQTYFEGQKKDMCFDLVIIGGDWDPMVVTHSWKPGII